MNPKARQYGVLATEVGTDVVLYDEATGTAHRLDSTAAFVWQRCDGETPVEAMTEELRRHFGSSADEGVVWAVLEDLEGGGLLTRALDRPGRLDRSPFRQRTAVSAA